MTEPDISRELLRTIATIGKFIEETQGFLAKTLRLTYPQWSIIWAIKELNKGQGVPVGDVAKRLRVDASFVTAQTKLLEKSGAVRRVPSTTDGRIVLMSLSDKTLRGISALSPRMSALNEFIFSDFSADELKTLLNVCKKIESRIAKAGLLLELDE